VVGLYGQQVEAELLSLYNYAFKELGIDIIIKYNNRNLMKGLIKEANVSEDLIGSVITIVDKINKITKDEFITNLICLELDMDSINSILDYFNMTLKELNNVFIDTDNEDIKLGLTELNNLNEYIQAMGMDTYCIFTSSLARGQEYYTGNVFEVYDKENRITSSIGGGGRYDKIITNFINDGNAYPAVGISFGLTSIYEILKSNEELNEKSNIDIFIIPMGTPIESLKLANEFRNLGYRVDIEMAKRKIKNSMAFANKEKIPYVIVLGENEIESGVFKVKDMFNNESYELNFNNIKQFNTLIK
jgi:histidyl-tRNA synthetase